MVARAKDVVVIGSGVVGTAVAYFLSKQGVTVTVVDGNGIGSGASLHGTGLVWQLLWNNTTQYRLAMEGRNLLFDIVPQLHEQTGIDTLYHTFDTIVPIFDDEDAKYLDRDLDVGAGDIQMQWLSREEVLALEPRVNAEVVRGAFLTGSAQIDGYRLTLALARAAEIEGVQLLTRQITGVEKRNGRVAAVSYPGGRIPCEAVVVATGAWAGAASEWLGFPVPVKPLKGETIHVRHSDRFPYQVYRLSGGGASPRKDGTLSIGSTGTRRFSDADDDLVRLDFDTGATPDGRDHILGKAMFVIPDLERAEVVEHLAGPRPLSADGMPIIGPVPGLDGAYLATGHRNKGIHLSAITGKIICDFIVNGHADAATPLDMFLPDRFAGVKDPKFTAPGVTV